MNAQDQENLTKEAAAIVARLEAAKDDPAALEVLMRQHGERLVHIKDRLAATSQK
jgi:hypothetical protein